MAKRATRTASGYTKRSSNRCEGTDLLFYDRDRNGCLVDDALCDASDDLFTLFGQPSMADVDCVGIAVGLGPPCPRSTVSSVPSNTVSPPTNSGSATRTWTISSVVSAIAACFAAY